MTRWRSAISLVLSTSSALFACEAPPPEVSAQFVEVYAPCPRVYADVLIVIDDSPSMASYQGRIADTLQVVGMWLDESWEGEDLRFAITTTSVAGPTCAPDRAADGAGLTDSCRSRVLDFVGPGELDAAVSDTRATCLEYCPLEAIEVGLSPTDESPEHIDDLARRPWFETGNNPWHGNLDDTSLTEVLPCVGLRGHAGCEHESPMAAALRALERSHDPADPFHGFLREGAGLLIVVIGDEDDCSHPESSATMFDPDGERVFWSDPAAAAPTSAVCFNAGTACDADGCEVVDRRVDGTLTDNPDEAALVSVARFEDQLEQLAGGRHVALVSVGGVSSNGDIYWGTEPYEDHRAEYGWQPGCMDQQGHTGQPPARLLELEHSYSWGFSICEWDYVSAFTSLSSHSEGIPDYCLPESAASRREWWEPVEPACEAYVRRPDGSAELLPACEIVPVPGDPDRDISVPPQGADNCILWKTDSWARQQTPTYVDDSQCADRPWAHDDLGWARPSFRFADPFLRHQPHGSVYELRCEPFVMPDISDAPL